MPTAARSLHGEHKGGRYFKAGHIRFQDLTSANGKRFTEREDSGNDRGRWLSTKDEAMIKICGSKPRRANHRPGAGNNGKE